MEAMDESVPLLERLKFIAIYSSNLDEFFRVRVADIRNIERIDKKKINKKLDFNAEKLLRKIYKEVDSQLSQYGQAMGEIIDALKAKNHFICTSMEEIPEAFGQDLLSYFKTQVSAYLQPKKLDKDTELFLNNQAIYLAVQLANQEVYILNIPTDHLSRFYTNESEGRKYYIFLDDIIRLHLDMIFPSSKVVSSFAIKLNKDAELQIDDE